MSASAAAVSQPANTKSAKNGESAAVEPSDPEWFTKGVPIGNMQAPFYFGTSTSKNLMPKRDRFAVGLMQGIVVEARFLPESGVLALKIEQTTGHQTRPHGSVGYALLFQSGMTAEVAA